MSQWLPRTQVPGQQVRVTRTTTPLLPASAGLLEFNGLGRLGHFIAITADAPAWVSFYSSAAARQADGSRPITTDPMPGRGVLLDLVTTTPVETVAAGPGCTYFSSEVTTATPQPPLRALVRNTGTSPAAIALTVTAVVLVP